MQTPQGPFELAEADAVSISNRLVNATGETSMIRTQYTKNFPELTGQPPEIKKIHYSTVKEDLLQWIRTKKY